MNNLVLEILTDEVPYKIQIKSIKDTLDLFKKALESKAIEYKSLEVLGSARRLSVNIKEISLDVKDKKLQKKINAKSPKEVIEAFLKSNNIKKEDLIEEKTEKGTYLVANTTIKGGKTIDLLPTVIVEEVLNKMAFAKSMVWEENKIKWPRPIKSFLCFLDDEAVSFDYKGIKSGNNTEVDNLSKAISINSYNDYFARLEENKIVLDQTQRRQLILEAISKTEEKYNIKAKYSEDLLNEIIFLVETPKVIESTIAKKYLELPKELIIAVLVKNQRYICFERESGEISEVFLITANTKNEEAIEEIKKGNNKVLEARLEDGLWAYEEDLKIPFASRTAMLKDITFMEGMGSFVDKIKELMDIASIFDVNTQNSLKDIIKLSKNDLTTKAVREFPELQGIMGYYYAKEASISEEIAVAIKEQYETLPNSKLGGFLALLDRLDTIFRLFKLGKKPTSSSDPYALKRLGVSIIKIIDKYKIEGIPIFKEDDGIKDFFIDRIKFFLKEDGLDNDFIASVNFEGLISNCNEDVYVVISLLKFLNNLYKTKDINFINISYIYKRLNIVKNKKKVKSFGEFVLLNNDFFNNILNKLRNISGKEDKPIEYLVSIKPDLDSLLDNERIEGNQDYIDLLIHFKEVIERIIPINFSKLPD